MKKIFCGLLVLISGCSYFSDETKVRHVTVNWKDYGYPCQLLSLANDTTNLLKVTIDGVLVEDKFFPNTRFNKPFFPSKETVVHVGVSRVFDTNVSATNFAITLFPASTSYAGQVFTCHITD